MTSIELRSRPVPPSPDGATDGHDGSDGAAERVTGPVRPLVTRRRIQLALGLLWLLDGALQLQPFMFARGFATQIIAPTAAGQPTWVAWPVHRAAAVIGSQPVIFDLVFASVQLALGIGFLWPRTVRIAALGSVVWAGGIWLFGEGLGGLAGGKAALLTGAPGAAVLYAVLALAAWPASDADGTADSYGAGGVATWFPVAWAAVWLDMALLAVLPGNRSAAAVSDQITGSVSGVPGWLGHIDRITGRLVQQMGVTSVVVLVVVPVAIGLLGLGGTRRRRVAAWSGTAVALVVWIVGESFGYLASGMATDPNTGPLLVLGSVALMGVRPSRRRHDGPAITPEGGVEWEGPGLRPVDQAPVVGVV